jgi:tetratricopeptide (TPR) repeat protein/transcriptional regulator with XRE-family HTH domain
MESFSQLLNHYIQRLGLSDAELARAIGLSRQTIFRWREGATARPRHRDDVLAIARKLRLTTEERDRLLLAAGFRPEELGERDSLGLAVHKGTEIEQANRGAEEQRSRGAGERGYGEVAASAGTSSEKNPKPLLLVPAKSSVRGPSEVERGKATVSKTQIPRWFLAVIIGVLLLTGGGLWWLAQRQSDPAIKKSPTADIASPISRSIAPAAAGETLVLVTHFTNYASSQIGYNVAGRLAEALQQEVADTNLENIRIAVWPEPMGERNLALQTGQEMSATLIVYGEYDVGRIVVKMAHPADQSVFVDPALQRHVVDLQDLSATINSDLPQQVRSLALLALGQIYLGQNNADEARRLLVLARDNIQDDSTVDEKTWGLVNFYLGVAYQHGDLPDLDNAIDAYSQAIDAWPYMISSRLNRAAAYEARKQRGDLQQALEDVEAVVIIAPDWAPGYNNRASIRLNIGGVNNLELALADLEKALELEPDLPEAYINQAYIYFRQGAVMKEVAPTLEKALDLRPNYGTALNTFCWGYAIEQQPEVALPYCQQAVAAEPTKATFRDSRGVAYALLEDYSAAIADFEAYVSWLEEQQPDSIWEKDLARRQTWIEALKGGENPFTPEVLAELRQGFGE